MYHLFKQFIQQMIEVLLCVLRMQCEQDQQNLWSHRAHILGGGRQLVLKQINIIIADSNSNRDSRSVYSLLQGTILDGTGKEDVSQEYLTLLTVPFPLSFSTFICFCYLFNHSCFGLPCFTILSWPAFFPLFNYKNFQT